MVFSFASLFFQSEGDGRGSSNFLVGKCCLLLHGNGFHPGSAFSKRKGSVLLGTTSGCLGFDVAFGSATIKSEENICAVVNLKKLNSSSFR